MGDDEEGVVSLLSMGRVRGSERAAEQRLPECACAIVDVRPRLAGGPPVVEAPHLLAGLLVRLHILGLLKVAKLLLPHTWINVDAPDLDGTELCLQRVQRLLGALKG